MAKIEKSIEVNAPLRAVYNQWTQFEEFPCFMQGVKEVQQLDDTHLHWCAKVAGKEVEWDAEIFEQVPDQRISWRSTSGKENAGTVHFEALANDRTKVFLSMTYDLEGIAENLGDAVGVTSHRVSGDLKRFKKFIEDRGTETGAWRGEVHGGAKSAQPRTPNRGPEVLEALSHHHRQRGHSWRPS